MPHNSGKTNERRRLEEAKEVVVSDEDASAQAVRDQITTSWRRSRFWGVSSDSLDPPYLARIDDDGPLSAAAHEVLDHLANALVGTAMSVILTDAHGNVLERKTGESSLARHLDSIHLAPGFSYAEQHVGTNGIGSAIESRKPFFVAGAEHFVRPLASVSCAGAPIVHPLTGRIEGVVDLTCRAGDASPLMTLLASEAAAEIVQRLVEQASSRQRALLLAFLAADRRSAKPVLAMDAALVITNPSAARLLERSDHDAISDRALEVLSRGKSHGEVLLSDGRNVGLQVKRAEGTEAGVVVELNLMANVVKTGPRPRQGRGAEPSGLAGHSGAWLVTWDKTQASCRDNERLLLRGEPGSGKLATLIAAHSLGRPAEQMTVLDLGGADAHSATFGGRLGEVLTQASGTVVLRHLDALAGPESEQLRQRLDAAARSSGLWVTATTCSGAGRDAAGADLECCFDTVVELPPLRHRIDDIRELVAHLLGRMAPGRGVDVGPDAMSVLVRHPWTGNVAELEEALRFALARRPRGHITAAELPEWAYSTARQPLSRWESMERDLITRALVDEAGDKSKAAARLGISRATIYRKIRSYGIVAAGGDRTR